MTELRLKGPVHTTIRETNKPRLVTIIDVQWRPSKISDQDNLFVTFKLYNGERIYQVISPRADWIVRQYVAYFRLRRNRKGVYNFKRIIGRKCYIKIRDSYWNGVNDRYYRAELMPGRLV